MNAMYKIGDFVEFVERSEPVERVAKYWYPLRVHPNRERAIAEKLDRYKVTTYVPLELRSRRVGWNRRARYQVAIWPGIIFIPDYEADLRRLRGYADGISGYVRYGDTVSRGNETEMGRVRELEAKCNVPMSQRLKVGQAVNVVEGDLGSFAARFEGLDATGRLKVLVHMLGRQVLMTFDEDQIEPV